METAKSVAVFCGSHAVAEKYRVAAAELGRLIAERGWTLVFGASDCGTMKTVADAALDAGGRVVGVTTEQMSRRHPGSPRLSELVTLPALADRKAEMIRRADGIVALPGGLGTLDELFDALVTLKLARRPVRLGLLDLDGYYDGLLAFLRHSADEGFTPPGDLARIQVDASPAGLLGKLL